MKYRAAGIISMMATGAIVIACMASQASAQIVLQNDGFVDGASVGCQAGFVAGEIGAVRLVAEDDQYPVRLQKIRLIFAGDTDGVEQEVGVKIWQENPTPGDNPGPLVYDEDLMLTSAQNSFNEIDISSENLSFDGPFRVGIAFKHGGFPAICRDDDGGNAFPDRNFIFGAPLGGNNSWNQSIFYAVLGDWVIRAEVIPAGGPDPNNNTGNNNNNDPNNNTGNNNNEPQPEILVTSVTPASGPADEDNTLTIGGSGFDTSATFRVGSSTLSNVAVQSANVVTAVLPKNSLTPGVYDVIVQRGAESFQYASGFTVTEGGGGGDEPATLSITNVSPNIIKQGTRQQLTIVGGGFVGTPTVRVGSLPLEGAVVQTEPTVIIGTVPETLPVGTHDVIVTIGSETVTFPSGLTVEAENVEEPAADDGCGCSSVHSTPSAPAWPLVVALAFGLTLWRRRRA